MARYLQSQGSIFARKMIILVYSLPFLTSGVPNLGLDNLVINSDGTGGKLNADGRFGFLAELILCEATQKVRFSDPGIADQHQLEEVIVILIGSVYCHPVLSFLGSSSDFKLLLLIFIRVDSSSKRNRYVFSLFFFVLLEKLLSVGSWLLVYFHFFFCLRSCRGLLINGP